VHFPVFCQSLRLRKVHSSVGLYQSSPSAHLLGGPQPHPCHCKRNCPAFDCQMAIPYRQHVARAPRRSLKGKRKSGLASAIPPGRACLFLHPGLHANPPGLHKCALWESVRLDSRPLPAGGMQRGCAAGPLAKGAWYYHAHLQSSETPTLPCRMAGSHNTRPRECISAHYVIFGCLSARDSLWLCGKNWEGQLFRGLLLRF